MEHLYDLLEECTVKLTIGQSKGTGFFVAPGLILTCNHVVCGGGESSIEVVWNSQKILAQTEVVKSFPDYDLALLKVDPPINVQQPCVHLGEDFQPFDKLYLFGYSNDFPDGCSVTIDCEGTVGGDLKLIKFKLGNVRPGMSGSPLLNKRTGYVCGIVKFNLLDGIPGGGAVATSVILGKFPDLLELQQSFHQQDRRWNNFDRERDIDWHTICNDLLTEHRQQLSSNPLDVKGKSFDDVYVPLGLIERKEKQRPQIDRNLDPSADRGSELYRVEETTPIEHDEFLKAVCDRQPGEHIVILGEPGAGKTTLLTRVWESLLAANPEAPSIVIWVPLAALGSRSLEEYVEESWLRQVCEKEDKQAYLASLTSLRQSGRLYLLLDGADEIGGDGLKKIEEYLLQSKWAKPIKAVVTCRLNLWDGSDQNKLKQNFQIFRTLDFKYINSVGKDEVEAFILNWFGDDTEAGRKLRTALDEKGKERIKDLAQNPLRLTLLCNIWQEGEGLPDTQAGLYEQFVKYVYEWSKVPDAAELQLELDRVMGTLGKYGINKPSLRFRFTEDELQTQVPDLEDRKALKDLGWLNCVGAENRTKIYAFFHPTFQEYFAACNIDDWDYFLPKDHINKPVPCQDGKNSYRVFEAQWQQVILLWIGHPDVNDDVKEQFLMKITNFQDKEKGLYHYRCYCQSVAYISEFKNSKQQQIIVNKFVKWVIGENMEISEKIPQLMAERFLLQYKVNIGKYLHKLLLDIDNSSISIQDRTQKRRNVFKSLDSTGNLTKSLVEYLWQFIANEKMDFKNIRLAYHILEKYSSMQDIVNKEEVISFKNSMRYQEIRESAKNYANQVNAKRRFKQKKNDLPGSYRDNITRLSLLIEEFNNFPNQALSQYQKEELMDLIVNTKSYFNYEMSENLLKVLQDHRKVAEYIISIFDDKSYIEIRHKLARILVNSHADEAVAVERIIEAMENTNEMLELDILTKYLCEIAVRNKYLVKYIIEYLQQVFISKNISPTELTTQLNKILSRDVMPTFIHGVKYYLNHQSCTSTKMKGYYPLIIRCAQTLSYPEFHTAWHQTYLPTSFSPSLSTPPASNPNSIATTRPS
jgi:Trypsin-like peptidase domain/NACHT domain